MPQKQHETPCVNCPFSRAVKPGALGGTAPDCPNVRKGIRLLLKLIEATNAQSDGWHSWPAPSNAAQKLQELLKTAGNLNYGTSGKITADQLKKAVAPIRAMVTRQAKIQAKYGNKFEFDVDAALADDPAPAPEIESEQIVLTRDELIQKVKQIIADRKGAAEDMDVEERVSYVEGAEDGLAYLLVDLIPSLDGAADIKESLFS